MPRPVLAAFPVLGGEAGNFEGADGMLGAPWFADRVFTFDYATKRGMEQLGNRSAAAGGFNSGAARQQEGDFMANMAAQSQAQIDALAAGATGARQNKTDSMFRNAGAEIDFPAAGLYMLEADFSGAMAASSAVVLRANVAIRHDST